MEEGGGKDGEGEGGRGCSREGGRERWARGEDEEGEGERGHMRERRRERQVRREGGRKGGGGAR